MSWINGLPSSTAKFNAIEAHLIAITSYFMDEVYEFRNDVSSLKSILNNLISNGTAIDNQIITDTLNNNILKTKRKGELPSTITNTK